MNVNNQVYTLYPHKRKSPFDQERRLTILHGQKYWKLIYLNWHKSENSFYIMHLEKLSNWYLLKVKPDVCSEDLA